MMIELEEGAVGRVYTWLDAQPGVAKIRIGDKAVHGGKPNGIDEPREPRGPRTPRGHFNKTGEDRVIELLKAKAPRSLEELRQGFVEEGRSPKSISSCMHAMIKNDEVRRGEDGYYLSKKLKDRLRHQIVARKKRR